MRIELGRKGDYAVRAMLSVARRHGAGRLKAREIAAEMDIPARYLPQILAELVRAGLLTATAGPDGGYVLARPSDAISLLEVIEVAEGPLRTDVCILRGGPCDWDAVCPLHVPWGTAEHALRDQLARTSFAELARADAAIETGGYRGDGTEHRVSSPRRGARSDGSAPTVRAPSKTPASARSRSRRS